MKKRQIGLIEASFILVMLLAILGISVISFRLAPEIPVLFVTGLLLFWLRGRGFSFSDLQDGIKDGVSIAIIPLVIFILIGALIAVWIQAGIIPSMMVLGLKLINGQFFVPSVFLVCAIVGIAIGSGFTTISTVGIALLGIGISMHQNLGLVAGAIVSGAVFGDKMSPLSDSTNLASAVAESELFAHIKNMLWSTIPAFIGSLLLFWLLGHQGQVDQAEVKQTVQVLTQHFQVSGWAVIPILLLLICAWFKIPAIVTLFINLFATSGLIAVQTPISLTAFTKLMTNGFVAHTNSLQVNQLLTRGGISSMMGTATMIIATLSLGGLLMKFQIVQTAMQPLVEHLNTPFTLILATLCASIGINLFVGEQYLSVILPGRAFKAPFERIHLSPLALSRTLEDGGSVINYLIPWGVAGSFAASTLGVSVLTFLPFTFFSLLSPLFSLISAGTGLGLQRLTHK